VVRVMKDLIETRGKPGIVLSDNVL
jgi:hypothetical protein